MGAHDLRFRSAFQGLSICVGGSTGLAFDHADECAVTGGGTVIGRVWLVAQPAVGQWPLGGYLRGGLRLDPGTDETVHRLRARQRVEPPVACGAACLGPDAADEPHS